MQGRGRVQKTSTVELSLLNKTLVVDDHAKSRPPFQSTSFCLGGIMTKMHANEFAGYGQALKVLLVDDEPVILKMLGEWMSRLGHTWVQSANGMEAVVALNRETYDIVITDINMPRMDGMQLLKHVKKNLPHTDVIVISGQSGRYSFEDMIAAGAISFLTKPFLIKDLQAALNSGQVQRNLKQQLKKYGSRSALRPCHEAVDEL